MGSDHDRKDCGNLYAGIPDALPEEVIDDILRRDGIRVERILSQGHTAPAEGWFDQDQDEWVVVLSGSAEVRFEDEQANRKLIPGDYLMIPSHRRHRVASTDAENVTVWLAIFLPPNL